MVGSDDTLPLIVPTPTRRQMVNLRAATAILILGFTTIPTYIRRFEVAERSMSPSLAPGDYLISVISKQPRVGHIVIYPSPDDPSFFLVKRVIALGGSRVTLDRGIVTVDGTIRREAWSHGHGGGGEWEVGRDELFVLGDDRSISRGDSATIGPLAVKAIDSIVRFRYWPPTRFGPVRT